MIVFNYVFVDVIYFIILDGILLYNFREECNGPEELAKLLNCAKLLPF